MAATCLPDRVDVTVRRSGPIVAFRRSARH
jgi:hypothetical protein